MLTAGSLCSEVPSAMAAGFTVQKLSVFSPGTDSCEPSIYFLPLLQDNIFFEEDDMGFCFKGS